MLVITPRTFYVGGAGGGGRFLGQQGIIGGASGRTSVVGVGGRPWLQKVAALTVVISLTVATANTFNIVKDQYEYGYVDASALRAEVVGSLEIRIVRVISDAFLWLAQVQTLIRLFPRHKEKVIIKWAGFALIILDTIFAILNSFLVNSGKTKPRTFVDAIPALAYLFQLALSLLYAAWVIYYSYSKRRFAFYHPKMRNICLVAVLALAAVLIPVVFFVLDISNPNIAGWGDYFRWVGAAAASVVVWEWVERIETLERDEKKDGILGREIFDGDEMLDATTSQRVQWLDGADGHDRGNGGDAGAKSRVTGKSVLCGAANNPHRTPDVARRPKGVALVSVSRGALQRHSRGRTSPAGPPANRDPSQSSLVSPSTAATPVSRSATNSAASTEYAVHYHHMSLLSPPSAEQRFLHRSDLNNAPYQANIAANETGRLSTQSTLARSGDRAPTSANSETRPLPRWQGMTNPFKRGRASPPPELASATAFERQLNTMGIPSSSTSNTDQRHTMPKFGIKYMAKQVEKRRADANEKERERPIVIVPAQPRGRTWSPETLESGPLEIAVPQPESSAVTPGEAGTELSSADAHIAEYSDNQERIESSIPNHSRCEISVYPANVQDGQLLSQRGSLLISEARFRPGLQRSSSQIASNQDNHHLPHEQPSSQPAMLLPPLSQTESSTGDMGEQHFSSSHVDTGPSENNGHSTDLNTTNNPGDPIISNDMPP